MNRVILLLIAISIGLSAQAFSWQDLIIPATQTYQPYQQLIPAQVVQPAQTTDYSIVQPYTQSYNQMYYQNPYQGQYVNPYLYQRPYGYGSALPSIVSGLGSTNEAGEVIKNIGQSMIYSMIRNRGY